LEILQNMAFVINAALCTSLNGKDNGKGLAYIPVNLAEEFPVTAIPLSQIIGCNQDLPTVQCLISTSLGIHEVLTEKWSYRLIGIIGLNRDRRSKFGKLPTPVFES
jgi:hypothetical protein